MKDVGPAAPKRVGRPYILDKLPLEVIIPIMIQHGVNGGFLSTLPYKIYKETNHLISLAKLASIKDSEFLEAKSLAKAACLDYWTNKMEMACIQTSAWIWISKNLSEGEFVDQRQVKLELDDKPKRLTEEQIEERTKLLRQRIKEISR